MNVVVDIGNSSLKWAIPPRRDQLRQDSAWNVHRLPHGEDSDFASLFEALAPGTGHASWWVSSVHQGGRDQLVRAIHEYRAHDQIHLIASTDVEMRMDVDQPSRVGVDRVMGAYAISRRTKLNEYGIVIDFGTATTVNVVDNAQVFLGGCILPGIRSQLAALSQSTDQLPHADWQQNDPPALIGRDTREAILSGIIHAHQHGVVGLVEQIKAELPLPARVWVTGGGLPGQALLESLQATWIPHLVLEGIATFAYSKISTS